MRQYQHLLEYILDYGEDRQDRTGVGTKGVFGYQIRLDLSEGFPLVTTKKVHFKSVVYELLWFLRGDTNIKYLNDHGVTIWDSWADQNGELGNIYGAQWRKWRNSEGKEIDQIYRLTDSLRYNPYSRRHILSAWNVGEIDQMALPPCHCFTQFYVSNNKRLSCHLYMRSCDAFLGLPFNIASYALLTEMLAQVCGYKVGELVISFGDLHIYQNHLEQVNLQLSRAPKPLPKLILTPTIKDIFDFDYEDISLVNYQYHPAIKAEVAV